MIGKRRSLAQMQTITKPEFARLLHAAETEVIISIMAQRKTAGKGNALFSMYCKLFL
jgi:hypothetical protein